MENGFIYELLAQASKQRGLSIEKFFLFQRNSLIGVCTVFQGLSVQKLRMNMVILFYFRVSRKQCRML